MNVSRFLQTLGRYNVFHWNVPMAAKRTDLTPVLPKTILVLLRKSYHSDRSNRSEYSYEWECKAITTSMMDEPHYNHGDVVIRYDLVAGERIIKRIDAEPIEIGESK